MTAHTAHPFSAADAVLRVAIVGLALGTAYIHSTLGGALFTLNAIGYVVLAAAMVAPFAIAGRLRWIVRVGLAGYAASTIAGWAIQGPFYTTAYVAKAIELALIVLVAIDLVRFYGNPFVQIPRELRAGLARLRGLVATFALALLALAVIASCSGASGSPTTQPSIAPNALTIAARDLTFSATTLAAPAGKPFQIVFDNQESAPHNVAIYRDASWTQKIFVEEPIGGPRVVIYDVPPLAAGTYYFRCDLHPDMKGNLTVN
jgi:plastocyanin